MSSPVLFDTLARSVLELPTFAGKTRLSKETDDAWMTRIVREYTYWMNVEVRQASTPEWKLQVVREWNYWYTQLEMEKDRLWQAAIRARRA